MLGAAVAVVLTPVVGAGTNTKPFTATFSPGTINGGTSSVVHLDVKNLSSNQSLGSVNVGAAANGATTLAVTAAAKSNAGASGTVSSTSSLVTLRNLSLAPGATFGVDITVTAPCAAGNYTWTVRAKQSNDFNGPPGNDFSFQASGSNLVTTVGAGSLDHFSVTNGSGASIGNQVVGLPGFTVKATAVDACGNVLTSYTDASTTLTGTLSTSPNGASPTYGAFGSWSSGSATATVVAVTAEPARTLSVKVGSTTYANPSNAFDVAGGPPTNASFTTQPTDTAVNTAIAPAVVVAATDQYGNPAGGYGLTVALTSGTGDPTATLTGGSATTDAAGVATFASLKVDKPGGPAVGTPKYTLDAKYAGTKLNTAASATSTGFSVDTAVTACDPLLTSCTLPQQNLSSPKNTTTTVTATVTDSSDSGSVNAIAFDVAGPPPSSVTGAGGGCANFVSSGSAGVVLDIRPYAQGLMKIQYGIPTKLIQLSPNNGNKFVPICAGSKRVVDGAPLDCTSDNATPWRSKLLDASGVFTGALGYAVCDAATGMWWGILPTYQDAVPAGNPLISAWNGGSAPDGSSLRVFTIDVPTPWDWQMKG